MYQQHPQSQQNASQYNTASTNCTYDPIENSANPVINSFDTKNQVLDFQVLQMLNNPNDVNEAAFNIKVRPKWALKSCKAKFFNFRLNQTTAMSITTPTSYPTILF